MDVYKTSIWVNPSAQNDAECTVKRGELGRRVDWDAKSLFYWIAIFLKNINYGGWKLMELLEGMIEFDEKSTQSKFMKGDRN